MHRRAFIAAATGTAVAATAAVSRPRLGQSDVNRFQSEYTELVALDQVVGGTSELENRSLELAGRIRSSLAAGGASTSVRNRLYSLASNVTCCAAFAAIDARARTRARTHLDSALTFAGLSGDSETQYQVWNHVGMLGGQRGDYAEAAAAADAARGLGVARQDPLYASLAHLRRALAQAGSRDRGAALKSLNAAEQSFARRPAVERPSWIGFYDQAELDGLTAVVWLRLGVPDRAEYHLHRTLGTLHPKRLRNRTCYTADLALAQAAQGELELACKTGDRTTELLGDVPGTRRAARTLADIRKIVISSGSKEPAVKEWAERAQAWT